MLFAGKKEQWGVPPIHLPRARYDICDLLRVAMRIDTHVSTVQNLLKAMGSSKSHRTVASSGKKFHCTVHG